MFLTKAHQLEMYRDFEIKKSNLQKEKFAAYPIPFFNIGEDYLYHNLNREKFSATDLQQYAKNWFQAPEIFLRPAEDFLPEVTEGTDGFLTFRSVLNPSQIVRFKYNPQPIGTPGRKIALIHIMHWNGRLNPYNKIIGLIRNTALPISTLIHIPAGRGLNPGDDTPVDYDSISPNVGKTIFRARQDVQDLQCIARYLKKKMGYEEVGLFTYSMGSLRGILAAIMSPELFDFGIFHTVANDFTDAVMQGVGTVGIAHGISKRIDIHLLRNLWSTISPGAYAKLFLRLPVHTRIVQCEYDFIFGRENVQRFNKEILKKRPDVDLEIIPASHTALGKFPMGLQIMWRNINYIYRHTQMGKYKRAKLFL